MYFLNNNSSGIVLDIIEEIHKNAKYLSEIDGAIGDGDHGINMDKGFLLARDRIKVKNVSFAEALKILGRTLVMDIGGSMGPIYGTMFNAMWKSLKDLDKINAEELCEAFSKSTTAIMELAGAKVGDKTLIDTLVPAVEYFEKAIHLDATFAESLNQLAQGAELGKESTRNLEAKIGRASRLQERSVGFLDAGATSCNIIIKSMAASIQGRIAVD